VHSAFADQVLRAEVEIGAAIPGVLQAGVCDVVITMIVQKSAQR
jgi:hypothetical protein